MLALNRLKEYHEEEFWYIKSKILMVESVIEKIEGQMELEL